ncbi:Yqey-like protein [compost metagenome]
MGGDRFVAEILRGLKAAILNEEVAQGKRDSGLDEATIEQIIAREVKKRNESASLYATAGRGELAETELKEAAVLQAYLPEQLGEAKLMIIIEKIVAEKGLSGPQAMGQVIGAVKQQVGNTADGATVARLVKQALN